MFLFSHFDRYVTCRECGKIGMIARHGKRVIWLDDYWTECHWLKAGEWNAVLAARVRAVRLSEDRPCDNPTAPELQA